MEQERDLNIRSLCRLCGSKTQSGDRVEIFARVELDHQIRSLLGLDISESELLPTFVCGECAAQLTDFNEFKDSSHRTDMMFREFLDNARGASCVDYPGLSDDVALDSLLTIDEFKFEDEPESDVSNYISEPVISANIEQVKESDPLSFEPNIIPESTSEVLRNNFNTNTQVKSSESSYQSHLYNYQTIVQTASPYPNIQSNYSTHTFPSQHSTLKDLLFGSRNEVQPIKSINITKVLSPSTNSAVQPCNSYTGVQIQNPHTATAVQPNDSYSRGQVLLPHSTSKGPNTESNYSAFNNSNKTRNTYKCTYCNKVLKFACELRNHIKIHTKDYEHFCQYCNKGFISKSKMQMHIREAHTKEFPFVCRKCGLKFVQQSKLRSHIETYHIKSKNYYCKICKMSYKLAKQLREHARRVHTDLAVPIAFSCDVCGKVFDDKTNLVKHISTMHQEAKKSEETVYPWSLERRNFKVTACTSTQDISSQVACVEPMPSVESSKSSQNSKQDPQIVNIDSEIEYDFLDTFKGKIFSGKTNSNCLKVKDHGTKNPRQTESSNNKETTNTTVPEMVLGQKSMENRNNSKEYDTKCSEQSNRPLENSDNSKVKRAFVKIISCPHCFLAFKHVIQLNFHIKHMHAINCTYCSKSFQSDLDLQEHIKAEHTNVDIDNTCLKPGQLQEHNAKELSEKKYFQCNLCPKELKNLRSLKVHNMRLHSENRKKYNCEICKDKEFFRKFSLTCHMNVKHLGILNTCEFCGKTFASISGLKSHCLSKHFNLNGPHMQHVCIICNKTFRIKKYLSVHLKTHTNIRPFQCSNCFKTFKYSNGLKSHLQRNKKCINISGIY